MTLEEITKEFIQKCGSTRKAASQVAKDTGFVVTISNEAIRKYSTGELRPSMKTIGDIIAAAQDGSPAQEWAARLAANAAATH